MTAMVLLSQWMESQTEIWMPTEHEGYDVSNFGRVQSYWVKQWQKAVLGSVPRVIRSQISVKHASITLGGRKGKRVYVHRLVAKAFLPNPNDWPEVNHITAYPADNRVDGLEWATHQGNHTHAQVNGLHHPGSRNGMARLTEQDVLDIRRRLSNKEKQDSIAKRYGISQAAVSGIKHRHSWGHI